MLGQKLALQTVNALDNRKSDAVLEFEKIILPWLELASKNGMKALILCRCTNSDRETEMFIYKKHHAKFKDMTCDHLKKIFKLLNRGHDFFIKYCKSQGITVTFKTNTDKTKVIQPYLSPVLIEHPEWEQVTFNWTDEQPPVQQQPTVQQPTVQQTPVQQTLYPSLEEFRQVPSAPPAEPDLVLHLHLHEAAMVPPNY